jgi:hypothetical protein
MMHILNRPMVKNALVLIVSGVIAAIVCSKVYGASPPERQHGMNLISRIANGQFLRTE